MQIMFFFVQLEPAPRARGQVTVLLSFIKFEYKTSFDLKNMDRNQDVALRAGVRSCVYNYILWEMENNTHSYVYYSV